MKEKISPFYPVLGLLTLCLLYISYKMFAPFLLAIFWAIVFSVAFYPVYLFLLRGIRKESVAAVIMVIISFVIIVGPLSYISYLLVIEVKDVVKHLSWEENSGLFLKKEDLMQTIDRIAEPLNLNREDIYATIVGIAESVKKSAVRIVNEKVFTVFHAIVDYFIMLFTMFFLLRDGHIFLDNIGRYLPMSESQKGHFFTRIKQVIAATLYGGVLIGLLHGIVGGLSFYVLGVPSPVLLGFLIFLFSFIPVFGTVTIWGPVAAYLFLTGAVFKGLIMVAIGTLVIAGAIDHVLKPKIIGGQARIHILLIFFGVLGGMHLFGIIGFIAGPLILAVLLLSLEMIKQQLEAPIATNTQSR